MSNKDYSSKQESMVADYLDMEVVSGSGCRDCMPGDISSLDWLVECKTHTSPGYPIKFVLSVWFKIADEAASSFKQPLLVVDDGSQKLDHTWVMFNTFAFSSDRMHFIKYPKGVGSSISFKDDFKNQLVSDDDSATVFRHKVGKFDWTICPISTFKKLLRGE